MSDNKMDKFRVCFRLKQHTPIIHFQSDQRGATLRATELKPKLDKFLLDRVEGISFVTNASGYRSLDYKVTIEQNISSREKIEERNPLFFANMGLNKLPAEERLKVEKFFKFSTKVFTITFFSFNLTVKQAIEEHFEAFVAQTNFGTRQSKGFGSFYLFDDTNGKSLPFDDSLIPFKTYSFKSTKRSYQNDIKLLYSFLRQGINYPKGQDACPETRFYTKPAIFAYAKSRGWTWDKKAIKEKFFSHALGEQIGCRGEVDVLSYEGDEAYLLRDLFGLSAEQSWKSYGKTISKEGKRKETQNRQEVTAIQRFKSPVTFKPVLNDEGESLTVYFWANDSVEEFLDEEFLIRTGKGGDSLVLKTPAEFSFDDFFDFAFNIDLSKHISGEFHAQSKYKVLSRIYQDIKASR